MCETLLDAPTAGVVCPPCWSAIETFTPPVCDRCGLPVLRVGLCGPCRTRERFVHVTRLRAVGPYEGALRAVLHAWKYDGRRSLAARLGPLVDRHARDVLEGADALVPVPLHASRRRARGFNQAADIASTLDLPRLDALVRTVATPPQARLSDGERLRNVRDAFGLTSTLVHDRVVVLVDDVCTTGATLEACARMLISGGAREVRAVTVAHALLVRERETP